MRWLKSLLILIAVLLALAVGLLFSVENDAVIPLNILIAELPPQRLSTWIIAAFFAGGVAGVAASSAALLRAKASKIQLRRRLRSLEARGDGKSVRSQ